MLEPRLTLSWNTHTQCTLNGEPIITVLRRFHIDLVYCLAIVNNIRTSAPSFVASRHSQHTIMSVNWNHGLVRCIV